MKTAIIAEKPSVAKEIAQIVGAKSKKDGYIENDQYMVTWAFGHLIALAMPEDYGFSGFKKENLPIIPDNFILKPKKIRAEKGYKADQGVLKQLKIIKDIFNECGSIIVATDAGREGELIFRYIYSYLNCSKPFKRLWISSLTDKAIKDGLNNLKKGSDYDNLYLSAKARSQADWLVGINASQALTISAGEGIYSLGRVQSPTLSIITERFLENKNFIPKKYFQLKIETEKETISFSLESKDKFDTKELVDPILEKIKQHKNIIVDAVEIKTVDEQPPLLYDLTSLQKQANIKYGFSADKTLSIAQKLYEQKVTTYPRTGSRYISDDIFETIPNLIENISQYDTFKHYTDLNNASLKSLNKRSVNTSKVTDHHAILITENKIKEEALEKDDIKIYQMIAGRVLEAFSQKCVKEKTTVLALCEQVEFTVNSTVLKKAGWKAVFNDIEESEETSKLPNIIQGDTLPINKLEALEKQTKPKPIHTEASLLSAMENAGKELENEEEKQAMKECGIGTPATRASIIETLFTRNYIIKEKKLLIPTNKGIATYEIIKNKKIADVAMTGNWENNLSKIEKGELQINTFESDIKTYTKEITNELLQATISIQDSNAIPCPKCKEGKIKFFNKVVKCNKEGCLIIFKNIASKDITDKQITDLITKLKTGLIKGFKSKAGKDFEACLVFDQEYKIKFSFK